MSINIESLLDKADLQIATQNYDKAIKIYSQIIEVNSNCDEAYLYRGELYGKIGQIDNALTDVLMAINIDPDYYEAYLSLAALYESQDNFDNAIKTCQKAIELKKDNRTAVIKCIQLLEVSADKYLSIHQPDKAVENYKKATEYAPGNLNLLYKYAFSLMRIGNFEKAHKCIDEVLQRDSNHVPTRSLLVAVYEKTGQTDKGWQEINALFNTYPGNAYIAITYGKYGLRAEQQLITIPKLQHVLRQSGLKADDELSLHMLLGKLYDSIYDYKNAFTHFSQANNLKYNNYDVSTFETQVSNIISFYSKEKYSALPDSTNDSSDCIFILGMPRSGTSLIEQIVSSHSKVHGGGELQYVPQMMHTIQTSRPGIEFPQVLSEINKAELDSYANDLLSSLKALSPETQKITDKLPHNFLFIGLIHKLLPNAKIINCVRDPIDNCLSCYFQHFGGYHPYAYNLSNLGKYYLQYQRLMSHWETTLEIPILNMRYEDVVNDTGTQVKNILSYLDLDWEDGCLEYYKNKRTVNTASYTQVERKIYKGAINRWKNYEPFISELIRALENSDYLYNPGHDLADNKFS